MPNLLKLVISLALPQIAGAIGSFFTFSAITTWYSTLVKPGFSPPNWVFGPVWTTLYLLMGISAYLVWKKGWNKALTVFIFQLVLNTLWSIIFFGLQNPGAAFAEVIILWLAILATIISFAKISRLAAWLLVPYLLWVSFAAYLNYSIWVLN